MPTTVQTITQTTGAAIGPSTFRFNPRDSLFSFSIGSVATSARIQFSADNGTTWEPGFLMTVAVTTTAGTFGFLPSSVIPNGIMNAPCLCRINSTVASNFTLKIITAT